jgi:hypothetical protein
VNVTGNNSKSDAISRYLQLATRESEQETKIPDGIGRKFDRQIYRVTMSHGMASAPALPFEIPLPHIAEFCILRTLCNILRKDAIFQKIEFRRQQIA